MKILFAVLLVAIACNSPAAPTTKTGEPSHEYPVAAADAIKPVGVKKGLEDDELLEIVQRQTFRYFWHYAHPKSGMARERSGTVRANFYWDFINESTDEPNLSKRTFGPEAIAVGGTGFGILATLVAVERKWITREAALNRLIQIADFLGEADSYHGIYPHFLNGETGKAIPFSKLDNAADIVETSYLMMGFLAARAYFNKGTLEERYLIKRIDQMGATQIGRGMRRTTSSCGTGARPTASR